LYEVFSECPEIVPLPLLPHQEVAEGLFQARFFQQGAVREDVRNGSVCQDGAVFHYDAARAQIHDHVQIMGSNDFGMGELARQMSSELESDPQKMWAMSFFGKPLSDMVREGLNGKLMRMPADAQEKVQETLTRIINDGDGGMICILL